MRRYGLHDDEWDRIEDLLPGRLGHVGVTTADNRLFVEAVLYRYRTGVWQLAVLPSAEAYCGATPTECVPFLGIAVSSITSTASLPPDHP
jgi:transposase